MNIMMEKMSGLSREMIIHPGETLRELLEDREMTQKELAERTGFSEKQVSKIVNGLASITANFAKKLEYVFGVTATFWLNLQANYDKELTDFEEENQIAVEEFEIITNLKRKKIIGYLERNSLISSGVDKVTHVLELRRFLEVGNLTVIPNMTMNAAFRGSASCQVDVYVLVVWQKICELNTKKQLVANELNKDTLKASIPEIKEIIRNPQNVQERLLSIFNRCGIAFTIVQHFTGAPVQGFIKKTDDNRIMLCMTIRHAFADIFWFTLFHEIAHILYDDYRHAFLDFSFTQNEIEDRANAFASEILIPSEMYTRFVANGVFDKFTINHFAQQINLPSYIIIGRLQKDQLLPYGFCKKPKFVWK